MKKKILLIGISVLIITFLFVRGIYNRISEQEANHRTQPTVSKEDHITKAQAAKMIALLSYSETEVESLERIITYQDTDESKWYDKYINSIVTLGYHDIEGIKEGTFHPLSELSNKECTNLLTSMGYQAVIGQLSFSMEEMIPTDYITQSQWMEIYELLLRELSIQDIQTKQVYIVGTLDSDKKSSTQIVTSEGVVGCSGISFDQSLDKSYLVYVKTDKTNTQPEIIAIQKEMEASLTTIENAWIIEGKGQKVKAFVNGCTRTFDAASPLADSLNDVVGDLIVDKGSVTKVNKKPEIISGKVLVANEQYIEVEGYGKLQLEEHYKIYRTYNELAMEHTNAILVGYSTTDFVVADGKICAALIKESIHAKNIRVLIKTTGFQDMIHNTVKLTVNCNFTAYVGKEQKKFKKGKVITLKVDSKWIKEGRVRIVPDKEDGKVTILSITRSGENPSYRGTMEVTNYENGLTLINELPLEEYLYAVIPSEMPTSYHIEALKVQAVCARSYAYKQLLAGNCSKYGAHVDDSVSYQVYNNIPENEASILAVKDTYGKVIEYDGDVISAYYFSTSCGYTSSADEVWLSSKPVSYLSGRLQTTKKNQKELDLTKESAFRDFIKEKTYNTYDDDFAWYRWNVKITCNDIKRVIDGNLKTRYEANPNLIQTLQPNGSYESVPINTIGEVKDIKITQRKTGGIATQVVIKGSLETIKVITEYNIRVLLAPLYDKVERQDKSTVEKLAMLPSAFVYIDPVKKDNVLKGFSFTGGGYGHGVGMSQNGVKAMADNGREYEYILKYYYSGVQLGYLY